LSKLNTREKKIITIEDPIEYTMEGIIQTEVDEKIGFTFDL
jgi:type II secretory ATPase GspE/PulE/Tfp pilus assembly ATPase PilB-like protein